MSPRVQRYTLGIIIGLTMAFIIVATYYDAALMMAIGSIILLLEIALVAPVFEKAEW